jgi:zinc protease
MARLIGALAALLLTTAAAPALAQPAAAPAVPPLAYHLRVLANGLRLYTAVDRSTPNVTVQVWYGVGSKDDPAGRSGFAHLFEHLMFKGTRDLPPESFDRLTEDVGGFNNASTNDDFTEYHEVIPANHLRRLIWAEAERLSGLVVDEADFKSERAVVEEELRQRVLADPYGRLFSLDIPEASFTVHPYHRPTIGSIADLDASSLADVRAFHATYYRPDNASLIVMGNFDPAALDKWVDQYFGAIARPTEAIPRVTAVEPARTGPKTIDAYGPNVPLPALVISYPSPDAANPDAAALKMADAILTAGKSSRLYDALVYRQQIAQSVLSNADLRRQGGLFAVGAVMADGKTLDQGDAALRAQVARLRDQPVSEAELSAAKNQLIAAVLRGRETVEGRATELGSTIAVEGDPARVNSDIAELQAVTAADIQRVARAWLRDDRAITIRYRTETERPAGAPDALTQESPLVAARPLAAPANIAVVETLPLERRTPPPPPSMAIAAQLPHAVERTLPNGLRVIVARTGDLPIVSAALSVRGGAALDPARQAGLADLTAGLLTQGTPTRSASAIAAEVEALGGSIGPAAGYDSETVSLNSLTATLPQGMAILADVVRHPAFEQDELDRLRQQKLNDLTVAMQDPATIGGMVMTAAVFGGGPFGHPVSGTPASLARIDRAAVVENHRRLFRPDNAVLVITGGIDPEAAFALAERDFGDWARPAGTPPATPSAGAPSPPRVVVVDLPGTGQAAVLIGGRSIGRRDPAYYTASVEDHVLGGGYSARLNEEVRVKRGLSYGASSSISFWGDVGYFQAAAQTKNQSADEVTGLILDQIRSLGAAPAPADELAARKADLIGDFGRSAATSAGLAQMVSIRAIEGVDIGEVERHAAGIEAVTGAAARAAANRVVDPNALDMVVVGDAHLFLDALRKRFPKLEVVPASALDLEAAGLKKETGVSGR